MGGSSRPSLRIGAPAGTLVLDASGESYVVVAPDGRTLFAQLSGLGRVYDGALDDQERPAAIPLRPGRSLVGGATDTTEGVGNIELARALRTGFVEAGDDEPPSRTLDRRIEALSAFLDSVAEERTRGHEIQRQRVLAAQDGDAERGAELQRQLIAHSQVVSRQRAALRALWERARAVALLVEPEPDPSEELRSRVRTLLGLVIPTPTILGPEDGEGEGDEPSAETDQN